MKLLKILLVLWFGNSYLLLAQKHFKLPQREYYLYNFKDKYYFISHDSTFETSDAIHWKAYPNKINCGYTPINSFNADSITFVFFNGGGNVYAFNGKKYIPYCLEGDFKNQYGSYTFIYQNKLHLFGGYGMFTDKNIITFFDLKHKKWDLITYKNQYLDLPLPRSSSLQAQLKGDEFYIGLGTHKFATSSTHWGNQVLNDFWKYNLKTNHWTKLGELVENINNPHRGVNYKNMLLLFDERKCYGIDIANNRLIKFPDKIPFEIYKDNVSYNPKTDCFLLVKGRNSIIEDVVIYPAEEFLGKKQIVSRLYKPINEDRNRIIAGSTILGIIALISLVYYRRKTRKISVYQQIEGNFKKICDSLDVDELAIFKLIWEKYPQKMSYADLMLVLDQKISYETQKKKLKNTLEEIDYKIQEILDIEEAVFIYSKNEIDRRMKDVRIR